MPNYSFICRLVQLTDYFKEQLAIRFRKVYLPSVLTDGLVNKYIFGL